MDWLINNKEWIFSGIGASILGLFVYLYKSQGVSQSVKNSTNVTQVGGNIKIEKSNDRSKR